MNKTTPNDGPQDTTYRAEQGHLNPARVWLWWVGAALLHGIVFSIPLTRGISQAVAPMIDLVIIMQPTPVPLPPDTPAHASNTPAAIGNKNVPHPTSTPTLTAPNIEIIPPEPNTLVDVAPPGKTRPSGADLLQQSIDMIRNNTVTEDAAPSLLEDISRRRDKSLPHDLTQADDVIALSQEEFESIKMMSGDTHIKVRMFGLEVCFNLTEQSPALANDMNMPERMLVFMRCR